MVKVRGDGTKTQSTKRLRGNSAKEGQGTSKKPRIHRINLGEAKEAEWEPVKVVTSVALAEEVAFED